MSCNGRVLQIAEVVITLGLLLATVAYAVITALMLRDSRVQRQMLIAPLVVPEVVRPSNAGWDVAISNVGRGRAYVSVRCRWGEGKWADVRSGIVLAPPPAGKERNTTVVTFGGPLPEELVDGSRLIVDAHYEDELGSAHRAARLYTWQKRERRFSYPAEFYSSWRGGWLSRRKQLRRWGCE